MSKLSKSIASNLQTTGNTGNSNSLVSINEIMNDQIINDQIIEEENEEIVNVQGLCRNGIDILDSVMSYDDMDSILNEENYRQLMDIFQKIYNSQ